jgi:AraC-like DNA-binding protein
VLDMARPSTAVTTDIDNLNLVLPREALDDLMPPFDMHGLVLQGGMAALLRSHLIELATHLPSFAAADARRLADVTLSLVAACIAPSNGALARARAPLKTAVLAEVRRHIDRHLHSPELTPQSISQALGLPRSTLYAICQPVGGVAAFIQRRRLRRVHSLLIDPREQRRIAEIAHQYGFTNEAHFSRAFRRAFGYSPREARQAGGQNLPGGGGASGHDSYEAWMRRLGG